MKWVNTLSTGESGSQPCRFKSCHRRQKMKASGSNKGLEAFLQEKKMEKKELAFMSLGNKILAFPVEQNDEIVKKISLQTYQTIKARRKNSLITSLASLYQTKICQKINENELGGIYSNENELKSERFFISKKNEEIFRIRYVFPVGNPVGEPIAENLQDYLTLFCFSVPFRFEIPWEFSFFPRERLQEMLKAVRIDDFLKEEEQLAKDAPGEFLSPAHFHHRIMALREKCDQYISGPGSLCKTLVMRRHHEHEEEYCLEFAIRELFTRHMHLFIKHFENEATQALFRELSAILNEQKLNEEIRQETIRLLFSCQYLLTSFNRHCETARNIRNFLSSYNEISPEWDDVLCKKKIAEVQFNYRTSAFFFMGIFSEYYSARIPDEKSVAIMNTLLKSDFQEVFRLSPETLREGLETFITQRIKYDESSPRRITLPSSWKSFEDLAAAITPRLSKSDEYKIIHFSYFAKKLAEEQKLAKEDPARFLSLGHYAQRLCALGNDIANEIDFCFFNILIRYSPYYSKKEELSRVFSLTKAASLQFAATHMLSYLELSALKKNKLKEILILTAENVWFRKKAYPDTVKKAIAAIRYLYLSLTAYDRDIRHIEKKIGLNEELPEAWRNNALRQKLGELQLSHDDFCEGDKEEISELFSRNGIEYSNHINKGLLIYSSSRMLPDEDDLQLMNMILRYGQEDTTKGLIEYIDSLK